MIERVKFTHVTRVIDPKTRIHYLDAVDENGRHWTAQMTHTEEPWIIYKEVWKEDPQQPKNDVKKAPLQTLEEAQEAMKNLIKM